MAHVRKRGLRWSICFTDRNGKAKEISSKATTKKDALKLAFEVESLEERYRLGVEKPGPKRVEWGEFCDRILKQVGPTLRSPATLKSRIEKHLRPALSGRVVCELTAEDVQLVIAERTGKLSPQTLEHLRRTLRMMLGHAVRWKMYDGPNPASQVKAVEVIREEPKYLERSEIVDLMRTVPVFWRPMVALAITLGLRKGELLGLRRSNIDLSRGLVLVQHSYSRLATKSGKSRWVAIPKEAIPLLEAALAWPTGTDYVFTDGRDRPFNSDFRVNELLQKWLKAAGIEKRILWKDLRSTFGTHAAEIDLRFAQHSLGHSDPKLTAERYAAVRKQALLGHAAKFELLTDNRPAGSATKLPLLTANNQKTEGGHMLEERAMLGSNQRPLAPEANVEIEFSGGYSALNGIYCEFCGVIEHGPAQSCSEPHPNEATETGIFPTSPGGAR